MTSRGIASALGEATLPSNLRHGAAITLAFFVVYYAFILRQIIVKTKLRHRYHDQDKKFDRYIVQEGALLGWDRTVGNMLEQMGPFLGIFWVNILLCPYGGLPLVCIALAGWSYVLLRSLYPVLWFNGGGGPGGARTPIAKVTYPMYAIVLSLLVNAAIVICIA